MNMGELAEGTVYGLFAKPIWRLEHRMPESQNHGNEPRNGHFDPGFRTDANLVEPMLAAARAEATIGEICEALRSVWGSYTEPPAF